VTDARHAFLNRLTAENRLVVTARVDPLFLTLYKGNARTQARSRAALELRIEVEPLLAEARFQYRQVRQRAGFGKNL
jgi:hypothetical protein